MKHLIKILLFALIMLALNGLTYGQRIIQYANGSATDTAYSTCGWTKINGGLRLVALSNTDTMKVLSVDATGKLILVNKGASGGTYSAGYGLINTDNIFSIDPAIIPSLDNVDSIVAPINRYVKDSIPLEKVLRIGNLADTTLWICHSDSVNILYSPALLIEGHSNYAAPTGNIIQFKVTGGTKANPTYPIEGQALGEIRCKDDDISQSLLEQGSISWRAEKYDSVTKQTGLLIFTGNGLQHGEAMYITGNKKVGINGYRVNTTPGQSIYPDAYLSINRHLRKDTATSLQITPIDKYSSLVQLQVRNGQIGNSFEIRDSVGDTLVYIDGLGYIHPKTISQGSPDDSTVTLSGGKIAKSAPLSSKADTGSIGIYQASLKNRYFYRPLINYWGDNLPSYLSSLTESTYSFASIKNAQNNIYLIGNTTISGNGVVIHLVKNRDTTLTALTANTNIGGISFEGSDGTNSLKQGAIIQAVASGNAWSSTNLGTLIDIRTTPDNLTAASTRIKTDGAANVIISPTVPSGATAYTLVGTTTALSTDKLQVNGSTISNGFSVNVASTSASTYSITNANGFIKVDATSNAVALTAPTSGISTGRIFYIKVVAGSNTVTITPATGTIDGSSSITVTGSTRIIFDGTNYYSL